MVPNLVLSQISAWANFFAKSYCQFFDRSHHVYATLIGEIAHDVLKKIADSDALYHNVEHTFLVAWVGQEFLKGKHQLEGTVTGRDWFHFILSLLCHDIGYVRGVCQQDDIQRQCYATGIGNEVVQLPMGATDASLTLFHVDRGKCFVTEIFQGCPGIDVGLIHQNIEATRFPPPARPDPTLPISYPDLARAADLIGQLSDPRYLKKIPALFYEFEEIGANQKLGYTHPDDMRWGYPAFYRTVVHPHIQQTFPYLQATLEGRGIVLQLETNVNQVECRNIR